MHLKVFLKLKKTLKTLSSGQKNPQKPNGLFFLKKKGFFQPCLHDELPDALLVVDASDDLDADLGDARIVGELQADVLQDFYHALPHAHTRVLNTGWLLLLTGCSVAQMVMHWPAVWQARVQIPARRPRVVFPSELTSNILTIYWPMILMCPCIIDFIGRNGLRGQVGDRGPWTLLGP
jgi:hypothetical protein